MILTNILILIILLLIILIILTNTNNDHYVAPDGRPNGPPGTRRSNIMIMNNT